MPYQTDRQLVASALHQAFLVNIIAEAEAQLLQDGEESDYSSASRSESSSSGSSSSSSSSSSKSSSDEEPLTASETPLDVMGQPYSKHYFVTCEAIPKDSNQLYLLLNDYKVNQPDIFRSYLHISPDCFDAVVEAIQDDEIFRNNSNNAQVPVTQQVAIALYHFGHYGNAASTMKVALWAGVGFIWIPAH